MARYDYQCQNCEHIEEKEYSIKAKRPKKLKANCSKCSPNKKQQFKAIISKGTSFSLTGGGWAKDLYHK